MKVQKKTFTKWCNSHLVRRFGQEFLIPEGKLEEAFETGCANVIFVGLFILSVSIMLMRLVNALYDIPMPGKYNKAPKLRPHLLDNITLAIKMLENQANVKTNFLKSEHLADKDLKMILGMVWSIILDYQIKGISIEGVVNFCVGNNLYKR